MRYAIVLFGLLAFVAFQVERSTGAALREVSTQISEVDEPLIIEEWSNDENKIKDAFKKLVGRAKARLSKLRDSLRKEVNNLKDRIKKEGVAEVAKDVAHKTMERVSKIRDAAKTVADSLGNNKVGNQARELVRRADEIINKINESIGKRPNEELDFDFELDFDEDEFDVEIIDEDELYEVLILEDDEEDLEIEPHGVVSAAVVKKITDAALKEVARAIEIGPGPAAKELAQSAKDRLLKARESLHHIRDQLGDNRLANGVRSVINKVDAALERVIKIISKATGYISLEDVYLNNELNELLSLQKLF